MAIVWWDNNETSKRKAVLHSTETVHDSRDTQRSGNVRDSKILSQLVYNLSQAMIHLSQVIGCPTYPCAHMDIRSFVPK